MSLENIPPDRTTTPHMQAERELSGWKEFFSTYSKPFEIIGGIGALVTFIIWLFGWLPFSLALFLGGLFLGLCFVGMVAHTFMTSHSPIESIGISKWLQAQPKLLKEKPPALEQVILDLKAEHERMVKELHDSKEIERENAKTIERLQRDNNALQMSINSRDDRLKQYSWLHLFAETQRKKIQEFVLVENCIINSSHLSEGKLYVDFTFSIFNLFICPVSIPKSEWAEIDGSIFFKGDPLSGATKIFNNEVKNCLPTDRKNFTIRQWVNPDEATKISKTLETTGNLFDFSELVVNIGGGDEHSEVKPMRLDLTRAMQHADLENKIIRLENENIQLRREIYSWQERAVYIEELTRTLGMFYLAYNQLEQNEMLSQNTANNLKGRFVMSLHRCFHDHKLEDEYCDNLPSLPDSIDGQKTWIDNQCSKLRSLIEEQKQGLSDDVQNDGSIPSS